MFNEGPIQECCDTLYQHLLLEPFSRIYRTCWEKAWTTFSAPEREQERDQVSTCGKKSSLNMFDHENGSNAEKKTSKHSCFRTHSKSSLVSIILFFCSSSKSVWSYLKQLLVSPFETNKLYDTTVNYNVIFIRPREIDGGTTTNFIISILILVRWAMNIMQRVERLDSPTIQKTQKDIGQVVSSPPSPHGLLDHQLVMIFFSSIISHL